MPGKDDNGIENNLNQNSCDAVLQRFYPMPIFTIRGTKAGHLIANKKFSIDLSIPHMHLQTFFSLCKIQVFFRGVFKLFIPDRS